MDAKVLTTRNKSRNLEFFEEKYPNLLPNQIRKTYLEKQGFKSRDDFDQTLNLFRKKVTKSNDFNLSIGFPLKYRLMSEIKKSKTFSPHMYRYASKTSIQEMAQFNEFAFGNFTSILDARNYFEALSTEKIPKEHILPKEVLPLVSNKKMDIKKHINKFIKKSIPCKVAGKAVKVYQNYHVDDDDGRIYYRYSTHYFSTEYLIITHESEIDKTVEEICSDLDDMELPSIGYFGTL